MRRTANSKISHLDTGDAVYVLPSISLVPQRIYVNRKIIEVQCVLKHLWFGGLGAG